MAQLIQMRQRIKAVETIKKITHAMRLISMSTHTRLRGKQEPLKEYQNAISTLFQKVKTATPAWNSSVLYPEQKISDKNLLILVGSQKGLCGNFNSALFRLFERTITPEQLPEMHIIAIGKKVVNFIKKGSTEKIVALYPEFTSATMPTIVHSLVDLIMSSTEPFTSVTFFSNKLKTFFTQKPHESILIPFEAKKQEKKANKLDLMWEHTPHEVLDILALQALEVTIQHLLFESLLAEQAARFISMDSSTRNAEKILEETILWYNKLRQAKITRELTELTGSF
ncbi:F0F1 ATP synthase subunit gamma [Candidatus Dependentiae bacterium]|nr:F0F1 ATP synthase subunit gamma [Candidatus Dependentiae bacterium]